MNVGARLLEPLCILWVVCGARTGTWGHASSCSGASPTPTSGSSASADELDLALTGGDLADVE